MQCIVDINNVQPNLRSASNILMNSLSPVSGDLEAYKFHIETCLCWTCESCGKYITSSSDILPGEEEAPYGPWQDRQARWAMNEGWYVQPLSSKGALISMNCLCPNCAAGRNLKI